MEIVSGRPDVRGDRWACEVYSASGLVQIQNELVNECVSDIIFYSVLVDFC